MGVSEKIKELELTNSILVKSVNSLIAEINSVQSPGQITTELTVNVSITGNDATANPLEAGNDIPFATPSAALAWVDGFILRAKVEILIDDGTYNDNIDYNGIEGTRITIKSLNPSVLTNFYSPPDLLRTSADHIALASPMFNVTIIPPVNTVGINVKTGSELSLGGIHVDCVTTNAKGAIEATGATVIFVDNMLCTEAVGNGFLFTRSVAKQIETGITILSIGAADADVRFVDNSRGMLLTSDIIVLNGELGGLVVYDNSHVSLKDGHFISSFNNDIGADNNSSVTLESINIDKDGDGTGDPNIAVRNVSKVITKDITVNSISFGSVLCANDSSFIADNAVFNGVVGYTLEALRHSTITIELSVSIIELGAGNGNSNGGIASDSSSIHLLSAGSIDVTANALEASGSSSIRNELLITNGDILSYNGSTIITTSHPNTNSPVIGVIGNNNSQIIGI